MDISSFYTCVPQTTIIWCMVPEIWSRKSDFLVILDYFLFSFYSSNNPENQHFEKMKKMPRDIILHMCTINGNHKIYGSWDMEQDRQFFLIFCPFTHLTTQKTNKSSQSNQSSQSHLEHSSIWSVWPNDWVFVYELSGSGFESSCGHRKSKFWKNEKNSWRYHFTHLHHKWKSLWCMVPEIWSATDKICCLFGPFFAPSNSKNYNFEKMKKNPGDIIILHVCTKNHDRMLHCSWDTTRDGCNFHFSF